MRGKLLLWTILACATVFTSPPAIASDHDDGESDSKARALNLTDLYVFREDWQTGSSSDNGNLIFIMNTGNRYVARQEYYFSTSARYEFHVSNVADNTVRPTGSDDTTFRFEFGAPDSNGEQVITMTVFKSGANMGATTSTTTGTLKTTSLNNSTTNTTSSLGIHTVTLNGTNFTVFAGLREDPFFFDVECYFRERAFALNAAGVGTFGGANRRECPILNGASATKQDDAMDFTSGYNVNSIVLRVPITYLSTTATTFDVWETISIPN